jgi:hypothetical protein
MKATYPVAALLALTLGVISCSRTGDLSGDVFVTKTGMLVRGAGVELLVVPASDRLESELRKIDNDYDKESKEYTERQGTPEKECRKDEELKKRIESEPSIRKRVDELVAATLSKKSLSRRDAELERPLVEVEAKEEMLVNLGGGKCLYPVFQQDRNVAWNARQEQAWKKCQEGKTDLVKCSKDSEAARWKKVEEDFSRLRNVTFDETPSAPDKRLRDLVLASGAKAVLADVNGHYEANGLPVGRYYLCAAMGKEYNWLVPVQIVPGAQKVHLSNANSGSLRFLKKGAADS